MDIGDIAPEFSLVGADDMIHTMGEFRGYRAILIMFVNKDAPWKPIQSLQEKYHARGVAFIAITHQTLEWSLTWPCLFDPTEEIAKRYDVTRTPQFFLFDQKRHLLYLGNLEHLKDAIEDHLDSRPVAYRL